MTERQDTSQQGVAKSGLLGFKFVPAYRELLYNPVENQLWVSSPYDDLVMMKRLGGTWLKKPVGKWSWYCCQKNLEKLLGVVPFDYLDERIEGVILEEQERELKIRAVKAIASRDDPMCLRIPGLKSTETRSIRNYQKLGVQFASVVKTGLLIGDQMGLGKSLSAIGTALYMKHNRGAKRCLVIAPASVKYNWKEELELWTDERFVIVDGPVKKRQQQWNDRSCFFVVTNPELIVNDFHSTEALQEPWDLIIIDEIQMLKSWGSKRSQAIKLLRVTQDGLRIGLSGTPLDGRLEHLHSVFEFLVPGLFPTKNIFLNNYAVKDFWGSVVEYKNVDEVRELIYPYFLRRLKKDVAKELPEKLFKTVYVEFTPEERKTYTAIAKRKHEITEESEAVVAVIRARQFCDAPGLLGESPTFGSKFNVFMETLEEVVDNGSKVLVFSMFERMVTLLKKAFDEKGWKYLWITGETDKRERPAIARRFNEDPEVDICVMDEAGSTGLNFQEASYVFHYDDNWASSVMQQRNDRAHRLTTKHVVTIVNFVCKNTVEDRVRAVLQKKDIVSAGTLGDNVEDISTIKVESLSFKKALDLL